jgi:uncharacterized protein (TIGR04255 family)
MADGGRLADATRPRASDPLPSFEKPPVVEVVLGFAFEPLALLTVAEMGVLWHERFQDFPTSVEQPPYRPPVERFGKARMFPSVQIDLLPLPQPRLWFMTEDKSEVIQMQRDWFACNWRRRDITEPEGMRSQYPRYRHVRGRFLSAYESFVDFVKAQDLGDVRATQCEIAYVNHIYPEAVWSSHSDIASVLGIVGSQPPSHFLPTIEQSSLQWSYLITSDGEAVGRLHVQFQPLFDQRSGEPIFVLTLTARGPVHEPSREGVERFLELGHEWIVRGFKEITKPAMWRVWGEHDHHD